MNRYLVSYDLVKPGANYDDLYAALRALGGQRVLLSQWLIITRMNAAQLRDHLMRYIDTNDRLLVNDFSEWAAYNPMLNLKAA